MHAVTCRVSHVTHVVPLRAHPCTTVLHACGAWAVEQWSLLSRAHAAAPHALCRDVEGAKAFDGERRAALVVLQNRVAVAV